jgi:trimeric autotransporter adhesin
MKSKLHHLFTVLALLALLTFNLQFSTVHAQGTAFTYQGQLQNSGSPANGTYNLTFTLFGTNTAGVAVAGPITNNAVLVTNGLFTVPLDFVPGVFTGATIWLEIGVETNDGSSFTTLTPRQELMPTPYAIYAGNVSAAGISGTIQSASLSGTYGNAVTLNNAGNSFSGTLAGNGASVTSVNAAALNGLNATNFWQLVGNNVSSSQFFGSTNDEPLRIRVNNLRALLITTNPADSANLIGGSPANAIDAGIEGSVIAGGGTTNYLGAASSNHISAPFSSIGGGSGNWIQSGSDHSVIGDGWNNIIASNSYQSVIAGGESNSISNTYSVVSGGQNNTASAGYAFIGGGQNNNASGAGAFIGSGNNNTNSSNEGTVSGGQNNTSSGQFQSTVGGGFGNTASAEYAVIGGGIGNTNSGPGAFIGGGEVNNASGELAAIGGGYDNNNSGSEAAIGGGYGNTASAEYAIIGGGIGNTNSGPGAFIGGGQKNNASGELAAIGSGGGNAASAVEAFIGGGNNNTNSSYAGTIAGGQNNIASGPDQSTVGGGYANQATNSYATVPGGAQNLAGGECSFAAGQQAQALHQGAFVWADLEGTPFDSTTTNQFNVRANGGVRFVTSGAGMTLDGQPVLAGSNGGGLTNFNASQLTSGVVPTSVLPGFQSNDEYETIGGGSSNTINGGDYGYATIAGGSGNTIDFEGDYAFIGGGQNNTVGFTAGWAVVGGGQNNNASGELATIGGGWYNTNSGPAGTIGGGQNNLANSTLATIGGGYDNIITASGFGAFIGGGGFDGSSLAGNTASGAASVIGGGLNNQAINSYATVPGGAHDIAGGEYSFAAGQQAQALHQGAFVWSDSQNALFTSTTNDQFLIRAQGGVGIGTSTTIAGAFTLNTNMFLSGHALYFRGVDESGANQNDHNHGLAYCGPGVTNFAPTVLPDGPVLWGFTGGVLGVMNGGAHAVLSWTNGGVSVNGSVYANGLLLTSDRNAKENFTALDGKAVLAKVAALNVTEWNYKTDRKDVQHIGPMAQDFHAAFALDGSDDKHISVVDEGGVALSAIQGLNQKVEEKETRIQEQAGEIADLKARLEKLEQLVTEKIGGPK